METFDKNIKINNRYLVKDTIGQGGMGIVYLVWDILRANLPVALKTIKADLIKPANLEIFKKEFDIMTRLSHPNLAKVYNFGYDPFLNCYYFTMEYIRGRTLADIINIKKPADTEKILRLIVQALRGLSFIHSRNIISRDIKPLNIMIQKDIIKIMDFGLSDIEKPDINTIKGSPLYLAPEVLRKDIDHRVDIYSLGIVFYQLITKNHIFDYSKFSSILSILRDREKFESMRKTSLDALKDKRIKYIISKMTDHDANKRYNSCTEIIIDINRKLGMSCSVETDETKESHLNGVQFTNRKAELYRILKKIDNQPDSHRIFILSSTAGYGKSRIFREIKKHCQLNDILFLESECLSQVKKPYYSIINILGQILLFSPETINNRYKKYLNSLLRSTGNINYSQGSLAIEKDEILENISRYILDFSKKCKNTIVVFINNLQWADEGSLQIYHRILQKMQMDKDSRLRVFGTVRSDFAENISSFLDQLRKDGLLIKVHLKPFRDKTISEYLRNTFGENRLDKSIFDAISGIDRSIRGNPLFLGEFFKLMVKKGILRRNGYCWDMKMDDEMPELSCDINDIISQRMDIVLKDPVVSKILKTLSLVRIGLNLSQISNIFSELSRNTVKNRIFDLERQEILRSERIGQDVLYYFSSDIIQDITEAKTGDRKALHGIIGDRLEHIFRKRIYNYIEDLAYHYENSNDMDKAVDYLIKAGKAGEQKYIGTKHILEYYQKALNIAERTDKPDPGKTMLYILISRTLIEEGDLTASLLYIEKAESSGKKGPETLYDILYVKGLIYQRMAAMEESIHYFSHAFKHADNKLPDYMGRKADCLNCIGITYLQINRFDQAMKYFKDSLDIRLNIYGQNNLDTFKSYHNIGVTYIRMKEPKKALLYLKKSKKIINSLGIKDHNTAYLWNNLSIAYALNKNRNLSFKYLENAMKLRLELLGEYHSHTAFSYINMGVFYTDSRDYKNALLYFEKALYIYQKRFGKDSPFIATALNNIGSCYFFMGKYDTAEEYLKKSLKIKKNAFGIRNTETLNNYIQLLELYYLKKDHKKLSSYKKRVTRLYRKYGTSEQVSRIKSLKLFKRNL